MPEVTKRRKWTSVAVAALLGVLVVAYLLGLFHFGPSPEQARAALAEAGWCQPDAPIVRREGKLFIGHWQCDLGTRRFGVGQGREYEGHFVREHNRWVARPRLSDTIF